MSDRVAALLAEMTLAEKLAQLGSAWVFQLADGDRLVPERARDLLGEGIGHITRISGASSLAPRAAAALANEIQRHLVKHTRLGIPAIVHEEVCSGFMGRDTTVFPQAIGLASTWEPELATALGDAVRRHMRAIGAHQGLAPVLDVCRDPRWGRTEETYGEDPHLVAAMGVAFISGLQGDDPSAGVAATLKHFVGYGASEGGLNWAPVSVGNRQLHDVYLHPFHAAVEAGGVLSVMHAYNELDGVPAAANAELLTGVLRDRWGFEGCVVSDYFAVRQLADYHRLVDDEAAAAAMALRAGVDVELPSTDCYGEPLSAALRDGAVTMADIDAAVARVLTTKEALGLFDEPYVDEAGLAIALDENATRESSVACDIAAKSLVLLRNDGVLPLTLSTAPQSTATPSTATPSTDSPASIAVIGPNADSVRNLYGDYSYPAAAEALDDLLNSGNSVSATAIDAVPQGEVPTLPAVSPAAGPTIAVALATRFGAAVRTARGCGVTDQSRAGFDEAVELAATSDVAVLVLGERAGLVEGCTSGESRDVSSLDLPGVQEDLARAVVATGTPVVAVLVAGRPIGSPWLHEHCAAVLVAWLPGDAGGPAVAGTLAGDLNPGGKLPISYPRSAGHLPVFYGHKLSGGRSHWNGDYVDAPVAPLYPFGHGLSYSTFSLAGAIATVREGAIATTADVTNTGDVPGDEVVQLYTRDPAASVTRPVLELVGFTRVPLEPGESRRVTFTTPFGQLGFHGADGRYVVESGAIDVFVGTSSTSLASAGTVDITVTDADPPPRTFAGVVEVTSPTLTSSSPAATLTSSSPAATTTH